MSEGSQLSIPTSSTESPGSPDIHQLFRLEVSEFISSCEDPQWYKVFALIDRLTRLVSIQYPATQTYYKDFLLKFVYEETPLPQFQCDLALLLAHEPLLYDYFSAFLKAKPTSSAHRNAARQYFCTLVGLPANVNTSASTQTNGQNLRQRPSIKEVGEFSEMVQERFQSCPGKLRDFLRLNLRRWRDGQSNSTRAQIVETLGEEKDLLEFFERIWPAERCGGRL